MVVDEEYIRLKTFYVYELVDSHTNETFYVGKGKGDRALQHELEAEKSEFLTEKTKRIREIKDAGNQVVVRVIGRYNTEKEAFAVESTLIHWVYGHKSLTNQQSGHGSDTIRPHGNFEKIDGIDIPKKVRAFDGSYSREKRALREEHDVVLFMQELKEFIEENTGLVLSEVHTKSARFTKLLYPVNDVFVVLGTSNSATKRVWVEVQAVDGRKESKEKVSKLCKQSILEEKNHGAVAKLPNFKNTTDKFEILSYFNQILAEVSRVSENVL